MDASCNVGRVDSIDMSLRQLIIAAFQHCCHC